MILRAILASWIGVTKPVPEGELADLKKNVLSALAAVSGLIILGGCAESDGSDFAERELQYRTESAQTYCKNEQNLEEGTDAYQECFDLVVKYGRATQLQGI